MGKSTITVNQQMASATGRRHLKEKAGRKARVIGGRRWKRRRRADSARCPLKIKREMGFRHELHAGGRIWEDGNCC